MYCHSTVVLNQDAQIGIGVRCTPESQNLKTTWLVKDLKVELGNKATDWTAAPEDIDSAINSKVNNNQQSIFNTLFANGQQGFILENNKVYINGEVIKANAINGSSIKAGTLDAGKITTGILQAKSGGSYLNLDNGSLMLGSTNMSSYLQ